MKILKNLFYFKLGINILLKLSAIFMSVFISRWVNANLSSPDRADYSLVIAYNSIILFVVNLGIPFLVQKYYTNELEEEDNGSFWTTTLALRVFSYFMAIVIILITFPLSRVENLFLIVSVFTAQFILLVDQSYAAISNAKGEIWKFSSTDFLAKFLLVITIYSAPAIFKFDKALNFALFIGASIVIYLLILILDHFINRKYIVWGKVKLGIIQQNYKQIFYISLTSLIVGIYLKTDLLFLKNFNFDDQVINGYDNAYKVFEISTVVAGTTIPSISSMIKKRMDKDTERKTKIMWQYVFFMLLFGIVLCLGVILFKDLALYIIKADQLYPLSKDALPILAVSLIGLPMSYYIANLLILTGNEKLDLYSVIMTTIFTISLYYFLIPQWGLIGASWATAISYLFDSFVKLILLRMITHETR